jgi:tellurite resistance protein TehA-like permease
MTTLLLTLAAFFGLSYALAYVIVRLDSEAQSKALLVLSVLFYVVAIGEMLWR